MHVIYNFMGILKFGSESIPLAKIQPFPNLAHTGTGQILALDFGWILKMPYKVRNSQYGTGIFCTVSVSNELLKLPFSSCVYLPCSHLLFKQMCTCTAVNRTWYFGHL